jgi:hypothetical protein
MFGYSNSNPNTRPAVTAGRISGGSGSQGLKYPSPFFDVAHTYLPASIKSMFQWCRFYYLTNPLISTVINKMAEYPLTDLVIDTDNKGLHKKWEEFFEEDIQLKQSLLDIGLFYMCYGNAPVTVSFPFIKWLTCAQCKHKVKAKNAQYRFKSYKFYLECSKCKHSGVAEVEDVTLPTTKGTRLVLWNPEDLDIRYNEVTGRTTYYYSIPAHIRNAIMMGNKEVIDELPHLFISAVKENKAVVPAPENTFHLRRPTVLTGKHNRGWGVPVMLPVLKDAFYLQIMKKSQESVLLERVLPLTVLFPQAASAAGEPFSTVNLQDWKNKISSEIQRWRKDRNYIPVLPLPIGQQVIGGDGRALLLNQEMRQVAEQIVTGMGAPIEFVMGGLSYSGSNVSLRMLENTFLRYMSNILRFVKFVIRRTADHVNWPTVGVHFKPFKMADDIQRKAYLFQMNQTGKLSDTTLRQDADVNPTEEDELMRKELKQRLVAVKEQQMAEAMIQGEVAVINAKYQAKAMVAQQQEQQQAMAGMQASAQGEPGEDIATPGVSGEMGGQGGSNQDSVGQIVQRLQAQAVLAAVMQVLLCQRNSPLDVAPKQLQYS